MIKHYIKTAFRNFKSNRLIFGGSIITILLCALCISLLSAFVHNELSMDDFHKQEGNIYMITYKDAPESKPKAWEANTFFNFNFQDHPEINTFTTIKKYNEGEIKFTHNESSFSPAGLVADSSFLNIFDFELAIGNRDEVMRDPEALILSKNFAKKIFADENPIGKNILITTRYRKQYTVKGILKKLPSNSSLNFDFIIPDHSMRFSRMGGNFVLVNNSFNRTKFTEKINKVGQQNDHYKDGITGMIPLNDLYFDGNIIDTIGIISKHGDKKSNHILMIIIAVIFIISMLNFSNLQIIQINSRVKNIGINKITGAGGKHILAQKLTEMAILIAISSILISLVFKIVLPYFNSLTGVNLSAELWQVFLLNVCILALLVTVAMAYPSVVFLRVHIVNSLKNQIFDQSKLSGRKAVTTVQFALTFVLLIASIVIVKQLDLMLNKELGFTSENTICTSMFHEPFYDKSKPRQQLIEQRNAYENKFEFVKNELEAHSSVKAFSLGHSPIDPFEMSWKLQGGNKDYSTEKSIVATPEFANILGLQLLEGRFFSREKDKSRGKKIVINEAAKKYWGINDITTQSILNKSWSRNGKGYEIIGVVKDYNFEHLSVKPQPLIILFFEDMEDNFLIQFEKGATQSGLQFVEQLFAKNNPDEAFHYSFLSDDVEALYQKEKRLSQIYILFTIIAPFARLNSFIMKIDLFNFISFFNDSFRNLSC